MLICTLEVCQAFFNAPEAIVKGDTKRFHTSRSNFLPLCQCSMLTQYKACRYQDYTPLCSHKKPVINLSLTLDFLEDGVWLDVIPHNYVLVIAK